MVNVATNIVHDNCVSKDNSIFSVAVELYDSSNCTPIVHESSAIVADLRLPIHRLVS